MASPIQDALGSRCGMRNSAQPSTEFAKQAADSHFFGFA